MRTAGPQRLWKRLRTRARLRTRLSARIPLPFPRKRAKACSGNLSAPSRVPSPFTTARERKPSAALPAQPFASAAFRSARTVRTSRFNINETSMPQIIHVDRMCNECGNCTVFCPYDSAPYTRKNSRCFRPNRNLMKVRTKAFFVLGRRNGETASRRRFGCSSWYAMRDRSKN